MTLDVLVQIALLSEGKFAILLNSVWARVRSLVSVDSEMVIEVMPLSEVHWAVWEITLQDFEISLSLRVLELENPEHLGRWDMWVRLLLIYFYLLVQADFAALDHFDLSTSKRNLISNALVLYLVTGQDHRLLLLLVLMMVIMVVVMVGAAVHVTAVG